MCLIRVVELYIHRGPCRKAMDREISDVHV
jgi:hypothetical protein